MVTARRRFNVAHEEGFYRVTTTANCTAGDAFVASGPLVAETYDTTTTSATGTNAFIPWTTYDRLWTQPQVDIVSDRARRAEEAQARAVEQTRALVRAREEQLQRYGGRRRFRHDPEPAHIYPFLSGGRHSMYDFGYNPDNYPNVERQSVPRTKTRRIRVRPPRRDCFGLLRDHDDNFRDEEYVDEDDWEVITKPFSLTPRDIESRRRDRRQRWARMEAHRQRESKSFELLKEWLSPNEYRDLMDDGLVKITTGDETYTIKKTPNETVLVTNNKTKYTVGDYCLVHEDGGYATGDVLLTKIMMIKTDPENFKRIAINNY